jgi:hypothetical protein
MRVGLGECLFELSNLFRSDFLLNRKGIHVVGTIFHWCPSSLFLKIYQNITYRW